MSRYGVISEVLQQVKLEPSNTDAWNTLGECFWKKKDLMGARDCYESALEAVRAGRPSAASVLMIATGTQCS